MSKITKKQLLKRLEALEEWSNWADNMLDELNHALPDPEYDAKCEAEAVDVDASLARHHARLGLTKPKLKVLDQSVFDGQDEEWRFAAVDANEHAKAFKDKPYMKNGEWMCTYTLHQNLGFGYDAANWQNSLIERESELTGSDLAKDYFNRGGCPRICFVGEDCDESLSDLVVAMVIGYAENTGFETSYNDFFPYATLVNAYGEELPASRFKK